MEYKVAPSLLAADFTRLGEQVHEIEEAGPPKWRWAVSVLLRTI